MKALHVLLIFLSVSLCKSAENCSETFEPTKASDCNSLKVDNDYYKCCYLWGKVHTIGMKAEVNYCIAITKQNYDNIKDYIEQIKKDSEKEKTIVDSIELKCSSCYLYISLFLLMILLL